MNSIIERPAAPDMASSSALRSPTAMVLDTATIDSVMRVAEIMATGKSTIPQHLRNNPGDCMAVVMQAMQWQMNPFAVAQKTHIVNGTLGYEAQLVNAVVSSSPLLISRLSYVWEGDWAGCSNGKNDKSPNLTVTVSAQLRGEPAPRSLTISMAQVGVRNSPNWEHDPKQQLAYLCTKRWARLHAPDVLLGVYTPDELLAPRGEVNITAEAEVIAEPHPLETYPQDKFDSNFPEWQGLIDSGRRKAADIIATIKTRYALTEQQETQLRACDGEQGAVYENA